MSQSKTIPHSDLAPSTPGKLKPDKFSAYIHRQRFQSSLFKFTVGSALFLGLFVFLFVFCSPPASPRPWPPRPPPRRRTPA